MRVTINSRGQLQWPSGKILTTEEILALPTKMWSRLEASGAVMPEKQKPPTVKKSRKPAPKND